jgi:hypothetical protein
MFVFCPFAGIMGNDRIRLSNLPNADAHFFRVIFVLILLVFELKVI